MAGGGHFGRGQESRRGYRQYRKYAGELLAVNGAARGSQLVDVVIMSLIVVNVLAVVLGTVDSIYQQYRELLLVIEYVSVAVFSAEYLARVWSAVEIPDFDSPVLGRVRFALRPVLLIDLLAILPFFLGAYLFDLRFLRALRLFRFFRLFKLARYSDSMRRFSVVLADKKEEFVITISATSILLLFASSAMYFVEHQAQPEHFGSIPATLWWGVVTLTTVGYGDVYPVTTMGKVMTGVIAFLGVGLFALPASILASGFVEEQESEQDRERAAEYCYCPHCGERLDE